MADENRASDADMPRCRFVKSGHIQPAISGLTACQIAARRRIRFISARLAWFVKALRRVVAFRPRLKRQQQAADRHRRGAEPEDLGSTQVATHLRTSCRSGLAYRLTLWSVLVS